MLSTINTGLGVIVPIDHWPIGIVRLVPLRIGFLGQWHPAVNPDADANAQKLGFENGYAAIAAYYGSSDWMDTPTPMLTNSDKLDILPLHAHPTLESHIVIAESTEGRHFVANPYFFMVYTAGNQLPYINDPDRVFVGLGEVLYVKLL